VRAGVRSDLTSSLGLSRSWSLSDSDFPYASDPLQEQCTAVLGLLQTDRQCSHIDVDENVGVLVGAPSNEKKLLRSHDKPS